MAATILVTPEELEGAAKKMEELAGEYEAKYTELYGEVEKMSQTSWTGNDSAAYVQQIDGFREDFEKMKKLMDSYALFLRNSAKAYRETQQSIAEAAKKLQN